MTELEYLDDLSSSGTLRLGALARVVDVLRGGGLAVLPTETGYMLAAVATSVDAVTGVFTAKRRSLDHAMHVACASLSMAGRYAVLNPMAVRLLGALTPGPCTVVAGSTGVLPDRLVTVNGTVGIRIPDHPATLQVLAEIDLPLTATSVNESGMAYQAPGRDVLASLGWPLGRRVCVVDAGDTTPFGLASTLVRVTGDEPEILREGPVSLDRIQAVLNR